MKGIKFLVFGLYAFLGLCSELVFIYVIEPIIYGMKLSEWGTGQYISHWIITCITWGIVAFLIVRTSKNEFSFDIFESKKTMKFWQWLILIVCILFNVFFNFFNWNGFKIVEEF